jgi:uncharacterized membrane protein YfcA
VTLAEAALLFVAALVAGGINAVAGGGSVITYPALVWAGLDPIVANATNTVTLWPGSLAAMAAFRRELRDARPWMAVLTAPSLVGGALGAVLLIRTPSEVFAAIVPFLILLATVLFALQEPITRWLHHRRHGSAAPAAAERPATGAVLFQLAIAVYGGYFGAGIGIMMLAALGLAGLTNIHLMIGLRNYLAVLINAIAAAYFVMTGTVSWGHAAIMVAGQIAGGSAGGFLTRRVGRAAVRRFVVLVGVAMALSLLVGL